MSSLCVNSCTNMDFSKASQESCLSITCGHTENRVTRYWKDLLRQQGFVAIIISARWNKSWWSPSHFYISINTVTFKALLNFLRGTDKQISRKIWPTWINIYNLTNSVLQSLFPPPFFINSLGFVFFFAGLLKWPNAQTINEVHSLAHPPFSLWQKLAKMLIPTFYPKIILTPMIFQM